MTGKRALIEGIVLLACGLIGVADGLRLIYFKSRISVEDFTGPGRYLFVVSVLMAIVGIAYLLIERGSRSPAPAPEPQSQDLTRNIVATIAVLALYISMIDLVGYLWSTPVFFVLILRVVGMPFNVRTIFVGIALGLTFYLLFVRLFGMSFPHGRLLS